jgi:hypothetical protein
MEIELLEEAEIETDELVVPHKNVVSTDPGPSFTKLMLACFKESYKPYPPIASHIRYENNIYEVDIYSPTIKT